MNLLEIIYKYDGMNMNKLRVLGVYKVQNNGGTTNCRHKVLEACWELGAATAFAFCSFSIVH